MMPLMCCSFGGANLQFSTRNFEITTALFVCSCDIGEPGTGAFCRYNCQA